MGYDRKYGRYFCTTIDYANITQEDGHINMMGDRGASCIV